MSEGHLVYWYWDSYESDASVYNRDETNQTYIFHQQLNITGPDWNYNLALDNDIMVIGGDDSTHIFALQDGNGSKQSLIIRLFPAF